MIYKLVTTDAVGCLKREYNVQFTLIFIITSNKILELIEVFKFTIFKLSFKFQKKIGTKRLFQIYDFQTA